jgi:hypothetical protein
MPTPAPTPVMGAECFEYNVCEQCANAETTMPRECRWCSRGVGDGVCRPLEALCPASFGNDIGQQVAQCPTNAVSF